MKIICVARNYALHAAEMKAEVPAAPIFFLKPATAWARSGEVPVPPFTARLEYEAELVFRIAQGGRNLAPRTLTEIVDAVTVGIDFTARDLQARLKAEGLPWEMAKAFDHSAWWGLWCPLTPEWENTPFRLFRNETLLQEGYGKDMIFSVEELLAAASRYFTLEPGDVLFTGTPAGVGPTYAGDVLQTYWGETCVGEAYVLKGD
jgi:2-keto-4-pentenoate hydratase/2-oxohepta-3-ene-1,7-dioic acid hydratase in catechol pathway